MTQPIRIALIGESWVSTSTHIKGWDFFSSSVYEEGQEFLQAALSGGEFDFHHIPGHKAPTDAPISMEELRQFDVVILSDIGANTLLLHPDVWLHGRTVANRLVLLRDWVLDGGALVMCGGYLSFAGIYGSAKYYKTPVEEVLPVTMFERDDRVEAPQGGVVTVRNSAHPILEGTDGPWPVLLGYNEVIAKQDAAVLAEIDGSPFIATQESGKGRTMVWTSDIGPHWCPEPFIQWEGYARIWQQTMQWLTGRRG